MIMLQTTAVRLVSTPGELQQKDSQFEVAVAFLFVF